MVMMEAEPFERLFPRQAQELIEKGAVQIIDVREPAEYEEGYLHGSVFVPLGDLMDNPSDYVKRNNVLFVCARGQRSALACEMAASLGFTKLYNLAGGLEKWKAEGFPIETKIPPQGSS